MKTFQIKLTGIEDVRNFVNFVSKYEVDIDLRSGRYVVDAKSLLAIFSLDLLQPIECVVHTENDEIVDKVMNDIGKYKV